MLKTITKKLFRSSWVMGILAWIVAKYITFVFRTSQWTFHGKENIQDYWDQKKPLITCFWHGRMLMMPCAWMSDSPFAMLISAHPDGQIIAKTIKHHRIDTVVGSSSKGGLEALRSILAQLKDKVSVGITPDGPRGPRFVASEGIVTISRLSGVDILPSTYSTCKMVTIGSWDRFRIPLPFGKATMCWGQPIPAPSKRASQQELEKVRQRVENELNQLCNLADKTCGTHPIK